MSKRPKPRGICAVCGRELAVHVPKGGDGSMWVPFRHRNPAGEPCEGHLYDATDVA